jgi:DNA-binding transcriptional LysR family regulator
MNLQQLKVFHVAATHGSFTRAAEALCLTQPGVSKHIRDLEEYYGVRLFDRLGRRVVLTQAGETVFAKTSVIFPLIDVLKEEMDDLRGLDRGSLTVGASVTAGIYLLPAMIGRFHSRYPLVTVSLDIGLNRQIVEKLLAGEVDIGFLGAPAGDDRLISVPFLKDEMALAVPAGHEWALRTEVDPHELSGQPFLLSREGSGTRSVVEERLEAAGVRLRNTIEFGNTEAVKKAVEAGLGISILSRWVTEREERLGLLSTLGIRGVGLGRSFFYAYRKERYLPASAAAFLQHATYRGSLAAGP